MFKLVIATILFVAIYYTNGSHYDIGQESQIRLKRENIESSMKSLSGLGEVDPGFVKIKPNKVLVNSDSNIKDSGQSKELEKLKEKRMSHEVNIEDESTNSDELKDKKSSDDFQTTTNSTRHITESTEIVGSKDCPRICCDGKCPTGYCHRCGENVGGILHHGKRMNSIVECEERCSMDENCHSFNWSPVYKGGWCSTNKNSEFVKEQIGDFILCFKAEFCDEDISGENHRNQSSIILPKPLDDLIGDRVKQTMASMGDSEEDSQQSYDDTLNVESQVGNSMDKTHEMRSENDNQSSFDHDDDDLESTEETIERKRTDEVISKSEYDARRMKDKKQISNEKKDGEVDIKESSSISSEDSISSADISSNNGKQLDDHKSRGWDLKGYRRLKRKKKSRKSRKRGKGRRKKGFRQLAVNYQWPSEEAYEKQYKVECDMNMKEMPEAFSDKTPHHSSSLGHQMNRLLKSGLHHHLKHKHLDDRGKKMKERRNLNATIINTWKMTPEEGGEPGCGFPVCAMIDMKPKRFKSICRLIEYMNKENMVRRVLHIQKGDCADAIDGKNHDAHWGEKNYHGCRKQPYGNQPYGKRHKKKSHYDGNPHIGTGSTLDLEVCAMIPDDNKNMAYTYSVCELMNKKLWDNKEVVTIHIGLGPCSALLDPEGCIKTEWFDTDDPCIYGDYESHFESMKNIVPYKRTRRFRNCLAEFKGENDVFQTTDGKLIPERQNVNLDYKARSLECVNELNDRRSKPRTPRYWYPRKIKCEDYKVQHCCRCLFGCYPHPDKEGHPIEVELPKVTTLFDDCEWRPFISLSFPSTNTWDLEMRSLALDDRKIFRNHVCGDQIANAMYIDARRIIDDIPWDETGEYITKNTPQWGFACLNVNSMEARGKLCSDYKTRYCCKKQSYSFWQDWEPWTKCTKTCGGGTQYRERRCKNEAAADCIGQKRQERECKRAVCKEEYKLHPWGPWSPCAVTCQCSHDPTVYIKFRKRTCDESDVRATSCPDRHTHQELYMEKHKCDIPACEESDTTTWSQWSSCSLTCGVGIQKRTRTCISLNTKEPIDPYKCKLDNFNLVTRQQCDAGPCPVDGKWTRFGPWSNCDVNCGEGNKKRISRCADPEPYKGGKECEGGTIDENKHQIKIEVESCIGTDKHGKERMCPIDCEWSDWGPWSPCSKSCGEPFEGLITKYRHIATKAQHGGIECKGKNFESEPCPHESCKVNKCDHGYENRSCKKDTCDARYGKPMSSNQWITHCPVDCQWAQWGPEEGCPICYQKKLRSYGEIEIRDNDMKRPVPERVFDRFNRIISRYRYDKDKGIAHACDSSETHYLCSEKKRQYEKFRKNGGKDCKADDYKMIRVCEKDKDVPHCPTKGHATWGRWLCWSECEGKCGERGFQTRKRQCISIDGGKCEHGSNTDKRNCPKMCTNDNGWSDWTRWTACDKHCGNGQQGRERICKPYQRGEIVKALEEGRLDKSMITCHEKKQKETQVCNHGPCGSVGWRKNKETNRYENLGQKHGKRTRIRS